eukprot:CAMPEP_0174373542 /NCGR_PEP_ID=MMETSP0811_2-20130205/107539_1 /TAXON_ID=73025 ORGANISM="Eutreptiella gymnastica-like, Strain CCMP1594" /NCGR_SAMPLE_ID=MMETSP0811_2 /ASSEMBLY_ACC=CAM_ASM_000667 /LENGTH=55 /DNA_ID=CAMNT_0015521991 /DNA_START=175 /DNA_END=339 /DNA_ORIENTATION=+
MTASGNQFFPQAWPLSLQGRACLSVRPEAILPQLETWDSAREGASVQFIHSFILW